ncbi:hypothetical protein [Novosphingobium sp. Leaf2]|uniref:hypothetical protein n=1 Tax=Novosphingobium sp. Leaf2 TaxID=1735670 RepID=UPI000712307F|nr:hypothetical protein [Novosphingobium sp. Leaf2]KQM22002.1 hypothetical protein ASE49_01455 [Novosphingobium sp. Leaf2]
MNLIVSAKCFGLQRPDGDAGNRPDHAHAGKAQRLAFSYIGKRRYVRIGSLQSWSMAHFKQHVRACISSTNLHKAKKKGRGCPRPFLVN